MDLSKLLICALIIFWGRIGAEVEGSFIKLEIVLLKEGGDEFVK